MQQNMHKNILEENGQKATIVTLITTYYSFIALYYPPQIAFILRVNMKLKLA